MNILFVASDNNRISGAFLSMAKLAMILQRDYGVNVSAVLPNDGDGGDLLEEYGVEYEIVPSRNWVVDIEEGKTGEREKEKEKELSGNEGAICRICEIIREKEIEILHINTTYSYVGAAAALGMKIPFIWHIREFLEEGQNRKIWDREKGYALISKASAIIAISDSVYEKYSQIFPADRLRVIYNGIDEKDFLRPERELFQGEKARFCIIGGIVPYKGHEELIRACGRLKRKGISDFELKIVGKGKEQFQRYLMQLVEKENLHGNVVFAGASNCIPEVLENTDILFVCSQNEAFGRTTVEGMMAGCLIIGADTAGTKELLEGGKNGYLYERGNVKNLSDTMEYVLRNKEEGNGRRKRGQKTAAMKYTAVKNAQAVYELYQDVRRTGGFENG